MPAKDVGVQQRTHGIALCEYVYCVSSGLTSWYGSAQTSAATGRSTATAAVGTRTTPGPRPSPVQSPTGTWSDRSASRAPVS